MGNKIRNIEYYKQNMPKVPEDFKDKFNDALNKYYINYDTQNLQNLSDEQKQYNNSVYGRYHKFHDWKSGPQELFDVLMVGPLTMREFFEHAGLNINEYKPEHHAAMAFTVEQLVGKVYHIDAQKAKKVGDNVVDIKYATIEDDKFKKKNSDGLYDLDINDKEYTLWDKFFDFFGYKTDHAQKVDFYNMCRKSLSERITEMELETGTVLNENTIKTVVESQKDKHTDRVNFVKSISDREKQWQKLFFGDKEPVPEYRFNYEGKKISGLTACIAMFAKANGYEQLGEIQKNETLINNILENKADGYILEEFRAVGEKYMKFIEEKQKSSEDNKTLDFFNDFTFDTKPENKLSELDKNFIKQIYPDLTQVPLEPYEGYNDTKDTDINLRNDYVHIKAKQELRILFGIKDKVFGKLSKGDAARIGALKNVKNSIAIFEKLENKDFVGMDKLLPEIKDPTNTSTILEKAGEEFKKADKYINNDSLAKENEDLVKDEEHLL